MMDEQTIDERLSLLADGELTGDETNETLLAVLDNEADRERLKEHLLLRQATGPLRRRGEAELSVRSIHSAGPRPDAPTARPFRRTLHWAPLAAAACIGGVLVLAGTLAVRLTATEPGGTVAVGAGHRTRPVRRISAADRRHVAEAFALHESVAGPLAWYAADDSEIQVAPATSSRESAGDPVAVVLRFARANESGRTLTVVCRDGQQAVISLPSRQAGQPPVRLVLSPQTDGERVTMQYAIALDADGRHEPAAVLTGRRHLAATDTSLGQLAINDELLDVTAAARPLER